MPWDRWIRYLAVSLELDERERYYWWVNSQQDPKKFKWTEDSKPAVNVGLKVMKFAQAALNKGHPYTPIKGDIWSYAKSRGFKKVFKMAEFDNDTGKFIKYVYIDEAGVRTTIPEGYITVASHHEESQKIARKVTGMES